MKPKTIFCDIDGTLVTHSLPTDSSKPSFKMELLPGTIEKLTEWDKKGYYIILITGRKQSLRKMTERQLAEAGIFYDKLLMGIGSGERIMINDMKPDGTKTATSINVSRNSGINDINI
jgi:hypothetical protein